MGARTEKITPEGAERIRLSREAQFIDHKGRDIEPRKLTQDISALGNSEGGDLYVGITDLERKWEGFANEEAANGHLQAFENFFPEGTDFHYEFLECDGYDGLVLHVQVNKSQAVVTASNGTAYKRVGAQSIPQIGEKLRLLQLAKGVVSFETELVNISKEVVTDSDVIKSFIKEVVPNTTPEPWLKKQNLLREERPTVAGTLLFADEPQAMLPKYCGIKVYRYKSRDLEGHRDLLAEDPITIEGDLYSQITEAVQATKEMIEKVSKLGDGGMESIVYPPETLHEILTNAVLHRDYSIKDDIHIRIFDDRVEVQSPGRLPANITPTNILTERFSRNGAIVRTLNKFPNPPNKDVGEGLNTAFVKMNELGLKSPEIRELENAVLVVIKHEPLASPEEIIMTYLSDHDQIKNAKAREITHVPTDHRIRNIFNRMADSNLIEKVPGTNTASTAWRKKK